MSLGKSVSVLGSNAMFGYSSRLVILRVLPFVLVAFGSVVKAGTQPNVVVVFIDDMGWADFLALAILTRKHQRLIVWPVKESLSSSSM